MKKELLLLMITIIIAAAVSAIPHRPGGDIQGQIGIYDNVSNTTNQTRVWNITDFDIITANEIQAGMSWDNLSNYPAACPAGSAISTLGDTVTCTVFLGDTKFSSVFINGTQSYNISVTDGTNLDIRGQNSSTGAGVRIFTKDSDDTDMVDLEIYAAGNGSTTDYSKMVFRYDPTDPGYYLWTQANGAYAAHPIYLQVAAFSKAWKLGKDGKITHGYESNFTGHTYAGNATFEDVKAKDMNASNVTIGVGGSNANPTLAFGDGDSGWYEVSDDTIYHVLAGLLKIQYTDNQVRAANGAGWMLSYSTASATVPNLIPDRADTNTGVGQMGDDVLTLIAGGKAGILINETDGSTVSIFPTNTSAVACNTANAGGIYYDNVEGSHYGCNGTVWNALY